MLVLFRDTNNGFLVLSVWSGEINIMGPNKWDWRLGSTLSLESWNRSLKCLCNLHPWRFLGFGWMKLEVLILHWCRSCFEWETGLYDFLMSLPTFVWFYEIYLKHPVSGQHLFFHNLFCNGIRLTCCLCKPHNAGLMLSSKERWSHQTVVSFQISVMTFPLISALVITSVRMYNSFLLAADLLV